MPSYSSDEFHRDWVYAITQDFKSADGQSARYAPGQPCQWGDEHARIPLPSQPATASLNADSTLLAVALEHEIHVYAINDFSLHQVLKGHISRVDAMSFHPKEPWNLVSCAMNHYGGSVEAEPAIIFWDLNKQRERVLEPEATVQALGQRAVEGMVAGLNEAGSAWKLTKNEMEDLAQDVEKAVRTLNIKSQVRENLLIHGRLESSFGGNIFNVDGTSMAFLPGDSPKSNSVDKWDICIWNTSKKEISLTLEGHTDAIMWVGFSPDDKLLGSVSWDKTFRIWSHVDGSLLHTFKSNGQNWTGCFSPDSRYFAGTSGEGRFWIWDVVEGSEVITYAFDPRGWCRTLDWRPDGNQIVIGGKFLGRLVLYDLESRSVVQERALSTEKSPEEARSMMRSFLEVSLARYLHGGRKIAFQASGDHGVEIIDLVSNQKWRFAPGQGQYKGWGAGFVILAKQGMIVSIDPDAVRFWKVPIGEEE